MIYLILISIIKALVAWFVLIYIGTNSTGMIGRGFFEKPLVSGNHFVTLLSILATIAMYFYLYFWWGILFVIAMALIMISRIPDLYWEVRILPKKLNMSYPVPKDIIRRELKLKTSFKDYFFTSLDWIALVILFITFFKT